MSSITKLSIDEIYLIAKQKMMQLGYGHFIIKHRSIKIAGRSTLQLSASSEYWFLREEKFGIDINSIYGFSGEQLVNYSELTNIHTGTINVINNTISDTIVEFLQVLPTKK